MSEYKDKQLNANRVTLACARELLGNISIPDVELEKVLENLRTYCSIVYQVHQKIKQENKESNQDNNQTISKDVGIADKRHNIQDAA